MRNSTPQQNSAFSSSSLILRTITGSCSRDLRASNLPSKKSFGMRIESFLYSAVFLGMFSSFFALKAESSISSIAYQKDSFSSFSQETLSNNSNGSPQNRMRAQPSTYSSTQSSNYPHEVKPPSFFEKRAEGWHWYENRLRLNDRKTSKREEEKNSSGRSPSSSSETPTEKIEAQRKALETKLHSAILEPSVENIITYILAQKALMDQSQRFSEAWQRAIMTTPSLDETLVHPVDQNARHVYYDEQRNKLSKKIQDLSSEYGLFFFFRKNCSYCHHFAPIVKRFADKYNWSVLGISLDGGTLSEFPHAKRDNGISARLGITHVPALIALHSKTGKLIPLAYGMVSENEIEERIELLTRFQAGDLKK